MRNATPEEQIKYFFVIKLTVYLMRREDAGTLEERNIGFAY